MISWRPPWHGSLLPRAASFGRQRSLRPQVQRISQKPRPAKKEKRSLPGREAKAKKAPVAVIGGGLSGLACAYALKHRGLPCEVFDTGKRGVGGRCSSRVLQGEGRTHLVDHAVQAFSVARPEVQALVDEMALDGAARRWEGRIGSLGADGAFVRRPSELWIGSKREGMASVPNWLARDLRLRRDVWVARLDSNGGWILKDQKGHQIGQTAYSFVVMAHNGKCADRLIRTAGRETVLHAPLRCAFKEAASPTSDRLELNSLWVCVLSVAGETKVPFDGAFVDDHQVLSWVGNNSAKYPAGEADVQVWTLISTPRYGARNKCPQEFIPPDVRRKISEELPGAFCELTGHDRARCRVLHLQLWGAAVPLNVCKQGFLLDAEANIGACGDWLAAPSVEGAIASGLAMGEAIAGEALVSSQVPLFQAFQAPAIGSFAEDKPAAKDASRRALQAESSREKKGVWNFAFGANLSPWKLRTKRGIAPLEQVPGKLPGWRLVFNHKGGMGNIEPLERCTAQGEDPGAVHGLLLLLKPPDFEKLSKMEHEYVTTEVEVEAYDGRVIRARAFVSPKDYRLATYPNPPERYIKLIRDGASSSSLHGEYQAWLRTIPGAQQRGAEYWDHAARRR